jgi:hypothetical protein
MGVSGGEANSQWDAVLIHDEVVLGAGLSTVN